MINKIRDVEVRDTTIDCEFFDGAVKRLDIADYPIMENIVSITDYSINTARDRITWGPDAILFAEEIWDHGILIERKTPELRYDLARFIAYAREIKNITQKQLAEQSGIHQSDISKFERGEGNPSFLTAERIMKALDSRIKLDVGKSSGGSTVYDIFELPEYVRAELYNGELVMMAQPLMVHSRLVSKLHTKFDLFIHMNGGSCEVFENTALMIEDDERNYFVPDLMVVCGDNYTKWGVINTADLIIEVVSDSSKTHDYKDKLSKYLEMGVREYWILDPIKKVVVTYYEGEDYMPCIYPLNNVAEDIPVKIYEGKLAISVTELAEIIENS